MDEKWQKYKHYYGLARKNMFEKKQLLLLNDAGC